MTCIEKDRKESQMWSDSVKPRLQSPAASCHPGVLPSPTKGVSLAWRRTCSHFVQFTNYLVKEISKAKWKHIWSKSVATNADKMCLMSLAAPGSGQQDMSSRNSGRGLRLRWRWLRGLGTSSVRGGTQDLSKITAGRLGSPYFRL